MSQKFGIVFEGKVGDKVNKGDIIAYVHANDEIKLRNAKNKLLEIIKIGDNAINNSDIILGVL